MTKMTKQDSDGSFAFERKKVEIEATSEALEVSPCTDNGGHYSPPSPPLGCSSCKMVIWGDFQLENGRRNREVI